MTDERELDLMDALRRAIGIAHWMSGSKDFAPHGQARDGWVKAHAELHDMESLITGTTPFVPGDSPRKAD